MGQLRPRGVPTAAAQDDVDLVDGRGDRPDLEGDLADVGPRVAVQRVDLGQVVQHPALDGVERSARAGLLRRLEDQPDAPGQQIKIAEPRQHHAGAEQNRGVHVVPAGVTDARDSWRRSRRSCRRAIGSASMSARRPTSPAESVEAARQHVAVGAGANGQHFGDQSDPLELVDDESGGAMLVVSDFRMGVDVPPDGDQPLVEERLLAAKSLRDARCRGRSRTSRSVFHAVELPAGNIPSRNKTFASD